MEARLIAHPWRTFRVPRVLRSGADFAVLEYVEHGPVLGTVEHGRAVGAALAEIHAVPFAGIVDDAPFPDLVDALVGYATSELAKARVAIGDRARTVLEAIAPEMREIAGPTVLLHGDFKASNLHWAGDRLLVLDWEFAYPGSALSDIGQLLRWSPPAEFVEGFVATYGPLPPEWQRWSAAFDLVNLAGVLANMSELEPGQRIADVTQRIEKTLALFETRESS